MRRRAFLGGASGALATLAATQAVSANERQLRSGRNALVLVGGVNRGAYQAGVIAALAERQGCADGQPLAYDVVCGTSIGALNGYFVATAQYSLLKSLWNDVISAQHVFRLKHPYDKIPNTDSGILTRLFAALSLGNGATKNVLGVLDPDPVWKMLDGYFASTAAVHIPLYIATTNLTRRTGQIFNWRATTLDGNRKQEIDEQLLADFPIKAVPVPPELLHSVLFASACLPLAFAPVTIPRKDGSGKLDQFCDGGVTANAPVNFAQLCAERLHVIIVDPKQPEPDVHYENAVEVAFGVFQTMQARIFFYQLLVAYAASRAAYPFEPYLIRPQNPLPGKLGDFNDRVSLQEMWRIGYEDGMRGWNLFEFPRNGMLSPFDLPVHA